MHEAKWYIILYVRAQGPEKGPSSTNKNTRRKVSLDILLCVYRGPGKSLDPSLRVTGQRNDERKRSHGYAPSNAGAGLVAVQTIKDPPRSALCSFQRAVRSREAMCGRPLLLFCGKLSIAW